MRKLCICYFLPEKSVHSTRFLTYFFDKGYEIYVFSNSSFKFYQWSPKNQFKNYEYSVGVFGIDKLKTVILRAAEVLVQNLTPIIKRMVDNLPPKIYYVFYISYNSLRKRIIKIQLKRIKPDLIHALFIGSFGIDAFLTGFHPYALTVWGSDIRDIDKLNKYRKNMLIKSLKNADAVTAPTKDLIRNCINNGSKESNSFTIGMPGIDIERFNNVNIGTILEELNIDENKKIIFCPRAMNPLYQIDLIVGAFSKVAKKNPNLLLLLLDYDTDITYLGRIEQQIVKLKINNRVRIFYNMPNPFDDMNKLYAISTIVISIPKSDGLPQSILESLASSCPVICGDLKTYDGIIDQNETGIRVSGDDQNEIAIAIQNLLENIQLRKKIIANGKKVVSLKGSFCKEMNKMEILYHGLIENVTSKKNNY